MLYRGARLYYEEDRNQQEISELLGISRATFYKYAPDRAKAASASA